MLTATPNHISLNKENPTPEPELAIVLYGRGMNSSEYATIHNVRNNKLMQGRLTDIGNVRRTIAMRANKVQVHHEHEALANASILPHNVLLNTESTLMWHTPAKSQAMWFSKAGGKGLNVQWPSLVWAIRNNGLQVFAKATNTRPTEKTRLYHAPLMNISQNGRLCQGGAQLPTEKTIHTIGLIESTLLDSYFTHLNFKISSNKSTCYTSDADHIAFWREKEATNSPVRAREMAFAMTMSDFIKKLTKGA